MQCLCVLILSSSDHSSLTCLTVHSQWGPLVDCLAHCSQSHGKTLLCTSCCLQGLSGIKDTKVNNFFCLSYQVEMAVCSTKKLIDIFTFDVPIVLNWLVLCVLLLQLSCVPPSIQISNSTSRPSYGGQGCAGNPKHYSFMAVMSLIATTMLVQVSHLVKLALMVLVVTAEGAVNIYSWTDIYDVYDYMQFGSYR